MSSNYQQHPELYPWVDPNYDAQREAAIATNVAQAMAEHDRTMANCKCEWDENGYFWNPDCPEHDCPEDADDEEWERWFASYRRDQERKAWKRGDRMWTCLEGLRRINNIVSAVDYGRRWNTITCDEAGDRYRVLFRLRSQIEDEILAIAREH